MMTKERMDYSEFLMLCCANIDLLLSKTDVDPKMVQHNSKFVAMPCPVHGGDNPSGMSMLKSNATWRCWTHDCQAKCGADIVGFMAGALFNSDDDMSVKEKRKEALKVMKQLVDVESLSAPNRNKADTLKFIHAAKVRSDKIKCNEFDLSFMNDLPYANLSSRGFKDETIKHFGIKFSELKDMTQDRVVIPIFDAQGVSIGYTARSIHDRCAKCRNYHCVDDKCYVRSAKWVHSKGLKTANVLFNLDEAKDECVSDPIILVEGAYDCINLWQCGIKNVVGVFGTCLSKNQERLLYNLTTSDIIIMMDDDDAGRKGANSIYKQLKRNFNLYKVRYPKGKTDPGEMNKRQINKCLSEKEMI